MSYLPEGTPLGDLRIIEEIEYYDRPVIFACQNELDHLFLAVLSSSTDDTETWLYAPMSQSRWEHVRSDAIELHDAFVHAEQRDIYRITQRLVDGTVLDVSTQQASTITDRELPLPGEFAELGAEQPEYVASRPISVRVSQTGRFAMDLVFASQRMLRHEVTTAFISRALLTIQGLLADILQAQTGEATERGPLPEQMKQSVELSLAGVYAGSFGVQLLGPEQRTLWSPGEADLALSALAELLDSTSTYDALYAQIRQLKTRVSAKYGALMDLLAHERTSLHMTWRSPSGSGGEADVPYAAAESTVTRLRREAEPTTTAIRAIGTLEGVWLSTQRFAIRSSHDPDEVFQGTAADTAMASLESATIRELYRALITKTSIERPLKEDPEVSYLLLALDPYVPGTTE